MTTDQPPAPRWLLMAPALAWLTVLMVVPCALVLVLAFFERGIYGGIDYTFTLENFARVARPALRSASCSTRRGSPRTATLIALLIGYPAAYAIALRPRRWQPVLLFLVVLPFWSNYLIRTYAWIVLLNREGLINRSCCAGSATRRAAVAALHRRRGHRRAGLQLPALRHPRVLRLAVAAQPRAARGLAPISAPRPCDHLPPRHPAADPARHRRRRGVRLRAVDRQFRHARPARRRPVPDDRQPRLRPVPDRQRLAVRRGAGDGADRLMMLLLLIQALRRRPSRPGRAPA